MSIKSALRQLPVISGVFGTGLFVLSVKMVYLADAEQGYFTLLRAEIILAAGIATTCPTKAEMNHGWGGTAILAFPL